VALVRRRAFALGLDGGRLLAQACDAGLDCVFGELAVEAAVDDHRGAALKFDHHPRGACVVDVLVAEPECRRSVRVPIELLVQGRRLLEQRLDLLAQPQLGDLVGTELAQMRREDLSLAFA
jgi:hypothetical protein